MTSLGTAPEDRINVLLERAANKNVDAVVIGPGPDLEYFGQYKALANERMTVLLAVVGNAPVVLIPKLEEEGAKSTPLASMGINVVTWEETENPYVKATELLGTSATIAVNDTLPARFLLPLQEGQPEARFFSAHPLIAPIREVKTQQEIEYLREAAQAIDAVHAQVAQWLQPGLTERDVALKIQEAILQQHETVEFIIVGSGPNGSSPHHSYSERVLQAGEPVVVDIGGLMPSGYGSDSTRTYHLGEPDPEFARAYAALQQAQAGAVEAVRPGQTCEGIDAIARDILTEAGLGEQFVHRTGHGIGLETHEDPYIVAGNRQQLVPGMAFSVEPGFYNGGKWGARIEDIVVCTEDGVDPLNRRPRELVIVDC